MNSELEQMLFLKGKTRLPNVLIAASECSPLSKTGGLADVAGALPKSLKAMGCDARVITPYHRCFKGKYDDRIEHMGETFVRLGKRTEYAGLEKLTLDGIIYYLVDNEYYFGDVIYRGGDGEVEQYAFFQRAILDLIPLLDFAPEVLHCNDWQTAMLPMLLKLQYSLQPQGKLKTVFSIHNLAFQGWLSPESAADLLDLDARWHGYDGIGHNGWCNFMKGGALFSEKVNTVSPTYANEIRTPEFGEGMDQVLLRRGADVSGILNGIDTVEFDPAADRRIPFHFDAEHPEDKVKAKAALLEALGLQVSVDIPVIAMVTRMTRQKGFDLVLQGLDELMARDVAFILLGSGDRDYENAMREYENRYKGRLCSYIGYNEDVARMIYAGADFLLMPSAFEPCGLSQMIAQRYGTLPIVHEVGGLRDTVTPYNCDTGEGDGFSFYDYNTGTMLGVITYALSVYYNKPVMNSLIHAAMTRDVSMGKCALEYAKLYVTILDSEKSEVLHLPGDEIYRSPMGAVRSGEKIRIRLRAADFADSVRLVAGDREYPMEHIGGGLLSEAVNIVNMFVPNGKTVVKTVGKIKRSNNEYKTTVEPIDTVMPVVVLVNSETASASEITSGSLQDFDRAVILGTRTYGKGLVQTPLDLPYNAQMKLTTSKYYIPSGRCIQAINYKHSNGGYLEHIPDSLTKVFHTANGREVRDGGGIKPDLELAPDSLPNIAYYLSASGRDSTEVMQEYVIDYIEKHPTIAPAEEFRLTDADFAEFKKRVLASGFTYDPESERAMKSLKKIMEFEGYMEDAKPEFEALEKKLAHNLDKDLDRHKEVIMQLLQNDIVTAYYYQAGTIANNLQHDKQMKAAVELLLDEAAYAKILKNTQSGGLKP